MHACNYACTYVYVPYRAKVRKKKSRYKYVAHVQCPQKTVITNLQKNSDGGKRRHNVAQR